jgi:UDP-N-acetylmuramoylalanine--D-glutamate ligase
VTTPPTRDNAFAEGLAGKQVGVVGLQRSGLALARELVRHGAAVLGTDEKPRTELPATVGELERLGVTLRCGEEAYRGLRECDLIVLSPGVPLDRPALAEARRQGIPVLGEVEFAYRLTPNEIVAVTGTKGKTTTVSLIGAMLSAAGIANRVCGNIGQPLVGEAAAAEPPEVLVVEVSSFQLESTERFRPRHAAILNVASDHLDRHASFGEYVGAKLKLLQNQTEKDHCYLSRDYAELRQAGESAAAPVTWLSAEQALHSGAWVNSANELCCRLPQWEGVLCATEDLKLLGRHNALNSLFAAAVAFEHGVSAAQVRSVLTTFEGVPHRLERVADVNGVTFWNDTMATTPFAAKAALEAMRGPTLILVGGRAKTDEFAPLIEALARLAKLTVCIGESGPTLAALARSAGVPRVEQAESLSDAVRAAFAAASAGDNVLLSPACASFDMFRDYADRGEQFRQCVADLRGD